MKIVKRVIASLTTATIAALGLIYIPYEYILPLVIGLVTLVHLEYSQMVAKKYEIMIWPGIVTGLVWMMVAFYPKIFCGYELQIMGFAVGSLFLYALFGKHNSPLAALGTTMLGLVYIPLMLSAFLAVPRLHNMTMLLYIVAIVKLSDMGGFAFGIAFGKHKMCPSISPNKSWEGMVGSIFGSVLMSLLFLPLTHFSYGKAIAFGIAAAVLGTLGDLVESRFKRECEVKDSATFMPAGMGGFLDMFDSLIFAPAALIGFM